MSETPSHVYDCCQYAMGLQDILYNVYAQKKKEMTWFEDNNHHVLESKNNMHRLIYCPLCHKMISKTECQKLRHNKDGKLYSVKTYHYDKISNIERTERKEQKNSKQQQELLNIELNKIINRIFNS